MQQLPDNTHWQGRRIWVLKQSGIFSWEFHRAAAALILEIQHWDVPPVLHPQGKDLHFLFHLLCSVVVFGSVSCWIHLLSVWWCLERAARGELFAEGISMGGKKKDNIPKTFIISSLEHNQYLMGHILVVALAVMRMVGLFCLRGLFQPKRFCDFMNFCFAGMCNVNRFAVNCWILLRYFLIRNIYIFPYI